VKKVITQAAELSTALLEDAVRCAEAGNSEEFLERFRELYGTVCAVTTVVLSFIPPSLRERAVREVLRRLEEEEIMFGLPRASLLEGEHAELV